MVLAFQQLYFIALGLSLNFLNFASAVPAEALGPSLGGNTSNALRGLLDIEKRQSTCGNWVRCGAKHCCPTSRYMCCSTGACCSPGTYCQWGTNGVMGCCRNGAICTGPAPTSSVAAKELTSVDTTPSL